MKKHLKLVSLLLALMLAVGLVPAASAEGTFKINCIGCIVTNILNEVITEAEEGDQLYISMDYRAVPTEGCYFTGYFTMNGAPIEQSYPEQAKISMPAYDITLVAMQETLRSVTLNLTDTEPQTAHNTMIGMIEMFMEEPEIFPYSFVDADGYHVSVDFNKDGAADVGMKFNSSDDTKGTAQRLAGADSLTDNYTIDMKPLAYNTNPYSSVTFKFVSEESAPPTGEEGEEEEPVEEEETFTVTFKPNKGKGTMKALEAKGGETVALTKNAFKRSGYIFSNWNTKADGSGTAYKNGAKVTLTENLTLFAQWKKIGLTLKTVTVKKSASKLVLKATLTTGGKPTKGVKLTFKFNGKTYTAKTDADGVAKVTVKSTVLKKLKVGAKVKYQVSYGSLKTVQKTATVKK